MELGRKYKVILSDNSEVVFTFIGGNNADIQFEDGSIIPLQSLSHHKHIETLPED